MKMTRIAKLEDELAQAREEKRSIVGRRQGPLDSVLGKDRGCRLVVVSL